MATVVVIAAIVVTVAVVGYFFFSQHPQQASGSHDADRSASSEFFGDRNDRPGGPGSEADGVAGDGQIVPGPSFEAGGNEPINQPSD